MAAENRAAVVIRRVRLRNYRSIAACDVELGPLTFLVGPNGSGKSNFLDALRHTTLRALGILVAVLQTRANPAVRFVGIEEPEVALHPAAAGYLRDALRESSRYAQVVVTSHSPELLGDSRITHESSVTILTPDRKKRGASSLVRANSNAPSRPWLAESAKAAVARPPHPERI